MRPLSAGFAIAACGMLAASCTTARADAWRPQPFAEATLSLQSPLGELRFGAVLKPGKPSRLARLTLAVDGKPLEVPVETYRDVVNPRVQETLALVPQDCNPTAPCNATAAVMIHYYPALGNPKLPKTAACASSWLRIVFDRDRVRSASIVECLGSKHERERAVHPPAS